MLVESNQFSLRLTPGAQHSLPSRLLPSQHPHLGEPLRRSASCLLLWPMPGLTGSPSQMVTCTVPGQEKKFLQYRDWQCPSRGFLAHWCESFFNSFQPALCLDTVWSGLHQVIRGRLAGRWFCLVVMAGLDSGLDTALLSSSSVTDN